MTTGDDDALGERGDRGWSERSESSRARVGGVTLYADTVRVLTEWTPPTPSRRALRQRFLDLLRRRARRRACRSPGRPHHRQRARGRRRGGAGAALPARADAPLGPARRPPRDRRTRPWSRPGCGRRPRSPGSPACGCTRNRSTSMCTGSTAGTVRPTTTTSGFAAIAPAGASEQVSEESTALGWFAPIALPRPLASATEPLVAPALAVVRVTAAGDRERQRQPEQLRSGAGRPGA